MVGWFALGGVSLGCRDGAPGLSSADGSTLEDSGNVRQDGGTRLAPDAALTDAALTDAALTDAAPTDATVRVDAGGADAGRPDAGPSADDRCRPAARPFGGGAGTSDDPFLLCSVEQLRNIDADGNFASRAMGHFLLTRDLTVGANWSPIGTIEGTLRGGGHSISGINVRFELVFVTHSSGFAEEVSGATIEDLVFIAPSVRADSSVAAVFGSVKGSTLRRVTVLDARVQVDVRRRGTGILSRSITGSELEDIVIEGGEVVAADAGLTGLLGWWFAHSTLRGARLDGILRNRDGGGNAGSVAGRCYGVVDIAEITVDLAVENYGYVGGLCGFAEREAEVTVRHARLSLAADGIVGRFGHLFGVFQANTFNARYILSEARAPTVENHCSTGFLFQGAQAVIADAYRLPGPSSSTVDSATSCAMPAVRLSAAEARRPSTFAGWPSPPWNIRAGVLPALAP